MRAVFRHLLRSELRNLQSLVRGQTLDELSALGQNNLGETGLVIGLELRPRERNSYLVERQDP